MLKNKAIKRFVNVLEKAEYGTLKMTAPDGVEYGFSGKKDPDYVHADIVIHDIRTVYWLLARGDIGFAEAYRDRLWESSDMIALFSFAIKNRKFLENYMGGSRLTQAFMRFLYFFQRNTLKGSKRNISAHYDLGNDFYKLWLDPSMTYSSALFSDPKQDLMAAQHSKYDRIIDHLNPSGSLLEIGCGWGGFAERAIAKGDHAIKGITLSKEQHDYANDRLNNSAQIVMEDYRQQDKKYDSIVSIEMIEAVGKQYWPTYFKTIKSCLAEKGNAVIQAIVLREDLFPAYLAKGDFIRTFIFPGGMLLTLDIFRNESKKAGLKVVDEYSFADSYALTLRRWLQNFNDKISEVKALGFDDNFIRIWRFYLSCCSATFACADTSVAQVQLQHAS